MPSTYSPNLRIELIQTGEQSGTWGSTTNTNLGTLIEDAISGYVSVSITSADQALTAVNGAADQSRNMVINLTTTTTANFNVYIPPADKFYVVRNSSAYAATFYCSTVIGNTTPAGTGATIPAGKETIIFSDGTNVSFGLDYAPNFETGALTASSASLASALSVSSGGTGQTTYTDGQLLIGNSSGNTLTKSTLTAGTGVSITNGAGTVTINNSGVTSLTAGSGISLSGATGAITVSSTVSGGDYALQSYVGPATWTKPAGLKKVKVTVVGAGGAGGTPPPGTVAAGGGGGGAAISYIPAPSIPGPVAVTAGSGASSFGAFCSATAGSTGGTYAPGIGAAAAQGGSGGVGSGGTINITGDGGSPSATVTGPGTFNAGGGGSSILGGGAVGVVGPSGGVVAGLPGGNYGGGGGGGFRATTAPGGAGGLGAPGIVIVEEFY